MVIGDGDDDDGVNVCLSNDDDCCNEVDILKWIMGMIISRWKCEKNLKTVPASP